MKLNTITKDVKFCNSFFSKFLGLMFRKNKDLALIFKFKKPKKHSIHTFFVFFTIDLIFLDNNNKIIEIKKDLKPFSIYFPRNKYLTLVELPKGKIDYCNIKKGDILKFSSNNHKQNK